MSNDAPHWLTEEEALALCGMDDKLEAFIASAIINVKGKWYHMNIAFTLLCGPFDTYEFCRRSCYMYARTAFTMS